MCLLDREAAHIPQKPSHLVFVIFAPAEGDSRQAGKSTLAVRTTHSRVAQGAQTIHPLWNLRLPQVPNRSRKETFLGMLFHKIVNTKVK